MIRVGDALSRLDGVRRSGRGWAARCPAHRDRSPSLSIAEGGGGRALLWCHAGCTYDEITGALGVERERRSDRRPPAAWVSPLDRARKRVLAEAQRQPWAGEETRLLYQISDAIRARYRAVCVARQVATIAGDRPESRALLATAAVVETETQALEAELDEVLR